MSDATRASTAVPPDALRVAIVDDDRTVREGLAFLVGSTPGYACIGSWESVEAALAAGAADPALSPQVLLLDVNLPGMLGSEGVRPLLVRFPEVTILMLTVYDEQDRVFESLCNGACGYLLKKTPPARLLEAIREAAAGGSPMSPEVARKVVRLFQKTGPPARLEAALTAQEARLLALLAEGRSYQAAADAMIVSINTVRNYIRSIYDKLHVHSKSEAVSKALRAGLI